MRWLTVPFDGVQFRSKVMEVPSAPISGDGRLSKGHADIVRGVSARRRANSVDID